MTVFNQYARYYDLLYREKDYAAEANFVHEVIRRYAPATRSILELGCGTGAHAAVLAEMGYRLHGVDRSPDMLDAAAARMAALRPELAERLSFSPGDVRTVRLGRSFDAVISLFHVMSYQTTNEDIASAFATAKQHLNPNGIFLFDCWYGPAVLMQKPAVRVRRLEDEKIFVTRIAEPVLHTAKNVVDVHYQLFITDKTKGSIDEVHEVHSLRYLFDQEIEMFLSQQQLRLLAAFEWMSGREPGVDTWGVCFVVQA